MMQQNQTPWPSGQAQADSPVRVLVAEDDEAMRALLVGTFERDGYAVVAVQNGAQLVRYFSSHILHGQRVPLPDLVVSDVRMPGPTGLQVLRGLRESDFAIPVILITGFGDDETHRQAGRLGALAVFDKPFDLDQLREAVAAAVRRRPE